MKNKLFSYLASKESINVAIRESEIFDRHKDFPIDDLIQEDDEATIQQSFGICIRQNEYGRNSFHYGNGRMVGGASGTSELDEYSLSEKMILDAIVRKILIDIDFARVKKVDLSEEELIELDRQKEIQKEKDEQILKNVCMFSTIQIKRALELLQSKDCHSSQTNSLNLEENEDFNTHSKWAYVAAFFKWLCNLIKSMFSCCRREAQVVPS